MNFILLESLEVYKAKTRPVIGELKCPKTTLVYQITPAVLINYVMSDILREEVYTDNCKIYQVVTDTSSAETVVKAIHKNSKGYYYKIHGKTKYLDEHNVKELEIFMEQAKECKLKEIQDKYNRKYE